MTTSTSPLVTVTPERFSLVAYDADRIVSIVRELAERVGVTNPIVVDVDERTPLSKMSAAVDGSSSDATVRLRFESGALENTKALTTFGESRARLSIGRMLLRAADRLSGRFQDAPQDTELTNPQNAAWDAYCGGRLERLGLGPVEQQYRYDFRNRFGFGDDTDAAFDRLWAADGLSWSDLPGT
ncbi:MAG: hypothetical protein ABJH68_05540 [Ilumatobacter sp.]